MNQEEAIKKISELEVPEEKKEWIRAYAENHIRAERMGEQMAKEAPVKELEHFEIHDVMKTLWKDRNIN